MGAGTVSHLQRERRAAGVQSRPRRPDHHVLWLGPSFPDRRRRANPDWMAGICTLDPDDPHSPALLEQYGRGHNIRGLRSYQSAEGPLDHPGVVRLWEAARRLGSRRQRPREPRQDRGSGRPPQEVPGPDGRARPLHVPGRGAGVRQDLDRSSRPRRSIRTCTPSSRSSRPAARAYPFEDLHDACHRIIAAYGPDRCLWGSAFPCELWCPKTTYAQQIRLFSHELGLDARARDAILGRTAHRLYFERKPNPPNTKKASDETTSLPHDERPGGRCRRWWATAGQAGPAPGRPEIRITDIKTFLVGLGRNHVFVKVETDQGIHGIGEAYSCGPDQATVATITDFKDWLVGQDPRNIEHLWAMMHDFSRFPGGSWSTRRSAASSTPSGTSRARRPDCPSTGSWAASAARRSGSTRASAGRAQPGG